MIFCRMIVRERTFSRAFGPPSLRGAKHRGIYLRHVLQNQYLIIGFCENGGKIWILRDRGKGFYERPKKVHFWKIQFQNLFQKSKNSNFAAIFIYIEYINEFWFCRKWYQQMESQKNFRDKLCQQ